MDARAAFFLARARSGTQVLGVIEWLIDRYQVTTDNTSGIKNDPNDWSEDPCYILDLIQRIITVSVETVRLVNSLPPLEEQAAPTKA